MTPPTPDIYSVVEKSMWIGLFEALKRFWWVIVGALILEAVAKRLRRK